MAIATYEDRLARYERARALREMGRTLEEIGEELGGLTKERVRQILERPPRQNGRPRTSTTRVETLRGRLRHWEARRANLIAESKPTTNVDERIARISAEIASLTSIP